MSFLKGSFLSLFLLQSCSIVSTLNLEEHDFQKAPQRIVWFQIAGLTEEHFSFVKFLNESKSKTSLENMQCVGKIWNYNLKELRADAFTSFTNQTTGNERSLETCEDIKSMPIWKYLAKEELDIFMLESGSDRTNSIAENRYCSASSSELIENVHFWRASEYFKYADEHFFHFENKDYFPLKKGIPIDDRSCSQGGCVSGLRENVQFLMSPIFEKKRHFFFLVRDFSFLKALKSKNIKEIKESLNDLERTLDFVLKKQELDSNLLLLVTTGEPYPFELPSKGKEWREYEKNKNIILYKKQSLLSSIWAKGASAENFCGVFHESETFKRIIAALKNKELIQRSFF